MPQSGYLCADLKNSLHASLIPSRGKNLLAWYWRWKKVPPKDYPASFYNYYFFSGVVVVVVLFWVKTMWSNVRKTSDGTSHKMTQHFCWCCCLLRVLDGFICDTKNKPILSLVYYNQHCLWYCEADFNTAKVGVRSF